MPFNVKDRLRSLLKLGLYMGKLKTVTIHQTQGRALDLSHLRRKPPKFTTKLHDRNSHRVELREGSVLFYLKNFFQRKTMEFIIKPPERVKGMTKLDKSLFKTTTKVPGIKIPVAKLSILTKILRKCILKLYKIRHIVELADGDADKLTHKLVLIDPTKVQIDGNKFLFSSEISEGLVSANMDLSLSAVYYADIDLTFDNFDTSTILDSVLPDNRNVSAFETIGHIAHLNIKDDLLDYKFLIGEVILDKIRFVKTVVNKLNTIDNTYRNFAMELIAGTEDYITTHKENGCSFEMDYSKVYWNSRLSTEHQRLVDGFETDAIIYDVFAGIGPFTIPAAKQGCRVLVNDLNPESYKWLTKNVKRNKVEKGVETFNLDAADFIKDIIKPDILAYWKSVEADKSESRMMYVIMNLPALAIDFLSSFRNLFADQNIVQNNVTLPIIHCYCFTPSDDKVKETIGERLKVALGYVVNFDLRYVRNVSPNKDMYCVTFTPDRSVLFADDSTHDSVPCDTEVSDEREPETKKQKCIE